MVKIAADCMTSSRPIYFVSARYIKIINYRPSLQLLGMHYMNYYTMILEPCDLFFLA